MVLARAQSIDWVDVKVQLKWNLFDYKMNFMRYDRISMLTQNNIKSKLNAFNHSSYCCHSTIPLWISTTFIWYVSSTARDKSQVDRMNFYLIFTFLLSFSSFQLSHPINIWIICPSEEQTRRSVECIQWLHQLIYTFCLQYVCFHIVLCFFAIIKNYFFFVDISCPWVMSSYP